MRIADPHHTRANLQHLPRGVAELKHIAGRALDREVLVERADEGLVRIEDDPVVSDFGNRAARGDGQAARAAASAKPRVHFVAMDQRRPAAPLGGEALRRHLHDAFEVLAR